LSKAVLFGQRSAAFFIEKRRFSHFKAPLHFFKTKNILFFKHLHKRTEELRKIITYPSSFAGNQASASLL